CRLLFFFCTALSVLVPFLFHDTPTPEIYTLSLHDALPISGSGRPEARGPQQGGRGRRWQRPCEVPLLLGRLETIHVPRTPFAPSDRKSTRLNSSHQIISYAVFCLKKKKKNIINDKHTQVNS